MRNYSAGRKRIVILACLFLLVFSLTACQGGKKSTDSDHYRDLLLSFDYGDEVTYVIGHKNPDSDTVGCAMAYANLLNEIGISAEAAISGPVNNETQYVFDALGISPPAVMESAAGKQFVLVDHSTYGQAIDGMQDARVVGIVDHHGIGDVVTSEQINVRSAPAGAAATLVFLSYQECDVPISKDMARIMLMAILSDTRNMSRNVTAADRDAYDTLTKIADIKDIDALYKGMAEALTSYGDMTVWEIFQSDYKEYNAGGVSYCIGDVNAYGEENVREIADRMYAIMADRYESMGLDMVFTIINNKGDDESENMMYMVAYGNGAEELLQEAYGNYDGSRYFIFKDNLSRKSDIVPALEKILTR